MHKECRTTCTQLLLCYSVPVSSIKAIVSPEFINIHSNLLRVLEQGFSMVREKITTGPRAANIIHLRYRQSDYYCLGSFFCLVGFSPNPVHAQ